jgi:hypothetical protein
VQERYARRQDYRRQSLAQRAEFGKKSEQEAAQERQLQQLQQLLQAQVQAQSSKFQLPSLKAAAQGAPGSAASQPLAGLAAKLAPLLEPLKGPDGAPTKGGQSAVIGFVAAVAGKAAGLF